MASLAYLGASGFWALLAISLLHALALAPTTNLADALALVASRRQGFEYGWARGAGSAAFIAALIAGGSVVSAFGLDVVVVLQAVLMLTVPFVLRLVPPVTVSNTKDTISREGVLALVRLPVFRRVVLAAALILGSHALHDTFSVIRWTNAGISPQTASVLWSLAVAAEVIVFFLIGPWLLDRLGPGRAIAIAAGQMQDRSLPLLLVGTVYVVGHLLLDTLSYVHPFGAFGITPWNPSTGLSFLFILLYGWRALPFYLAALMLANIVGRGLPVPLSIAVAETAIRGGVYGLALLLLLRPGVRFDRSLPSVRDLFLLLIVALGASATVAGTYVTLLIMTGLLPPQDFTQALLRCWVGDMIGIAVVTPFGLLALARWNLVKLDWEGALQMASSMALTMCVAVVYAETDQLQLFYLLFLPLTWIAVRSGIEGVSVALLLIQVGLFFALLLFGFRSAHRAGLRT
jgi:integral membrane sensor domain MASE1